MAVIYAYIIAFRGLKNNIKKDKIIIKNGSLFGMFWQENDYGKELLNKNMFEKRLVPTAVVWYTNL